MDQSSSSNRSFENQRSQSDGAGDLERNGRPIVEFSWEGVSEGDKICGRGWPVQTSDGKLEGHLYIHSSDDSPFKAEKR